MTKESSFLLTKWYLDCVAENGDAAESNGQVTDLEDVFLTLHDASLPGATREQERGNQGAHAWLRQETHRGACLHHRRLTQTPTAPREIAGTINVRFAGSR